MTQKHRANLGIDINKYEDRGGLTLRRMNFGLWLSQNRRKFSRGLIIFLIIACAAMFVYSTYNYIFYFLYGREADEKMVGEMTGTGVEIGIRNEANSPQELEVGNISIFKVAGKYDFLIPIKNVNAKHYSSFNYCLTAAGEVELACGSAFILPASSKFILVTGVETESSPNSVKFNVTDLFWQRLNAHTIPEWAEYQTARLNVGISNLKYSGYSTGGKTTFHTLSFTIKNNSPYSYVTMPLNIILYNGQAPTGLNAYSLDNFLSGESREVNLTWPSAGEKVSKAEVMPDVNILDNNVFLPYRGESVK